MTEANQWRREETAMQDLDNALWLVSSSLRNDSRYQNPHGFALLLILQSAIMTEIDHWKANGVDIRRGQSIVGGVALAMEEFNCTAEAQRLYAMGEASDLCHVLRRMAEKRKAFGRKRLPDTPQYGPDVDPAASDADLIEAFEKWRDRGRESRNFNPKPEAENGSLASE